MVDGRVLLAAVAVGALAAALTALVVRPTPRLARRVRPYTHAARSRLGRGADVVTGAGATSLPPGVLWRIWGPLLGSAADKLAGSRSPETDAALAARLRRARYRMTPEEYRVRRLGQTVAWGVGMGVVGYLALRNPPALLGFAAAGAAFGFTRLKGRLDNDLETRRSRMRVELYTINLQLAMQVRATPGLVKHVRRLCRRGRGEVIADLEEVLRWIHSGMSVPDAFERAAELTAEPWAARTYKLLAIADERGADLADGLLALSEEIRDGRREDMRRAAVRRTGAMLLPTIGILAPVMILFIAAPLPRLIFGAG